MRLEEGVGTLKQACFQGYPESAFYVQVPIGSRKSAIHNAYHSSLRPSSLFEPRHRSLKVVRKKTLEQMCAKHTGSKQCKMRKNRAEWVTTAQKGGKKIAHPALSRPRAS
jgi:hypothetical protein